MQGDLAAAAEVLATLRTQPNTAGQRTGTDHGADGIFPASWEKAGNLISSGLRHPHMAPKRPAISITHSQIPYAPEQGIDGAVAGNLLRSSRKSSVGSGKTPPIEPPRGGYLS